MMIRFMISMLPNQTDEANKAIDKIDSEEEAHRCKPGFDTERPAIKVKFIPPKLYLRDQEDDYFSPKPSREAYDDEHKEPASLTLEEDEPESRNGTEDDVEAIKVCESSKENKGAGSDINCPECGNSFPSLKSLYGHLRSHPNRGYRGASRPPTLSQRRPAHDDRVVVSPRRTKKARVEGSKRKQTEELEAAADTLMMIRESKSINVDEIDQILDTVRNAMMRIIRGKGIKADQSPEEEKKSSASSQKKGYQCSICHKSFRTHQALGGHRASHNKHKNSLDQADNGDGIGSNSPTAKPEHNCRVCGATFDSGQALGGHKRRHYLPQDTEGRRVGRSPLNFAVPSTVGARITDEAAMIDLNEPPSE